MEGQDVVQLLRDAIQRQGVSEGQGDGELPLAGLGLTSVGYACVSGRSCLPFLCTAFIYFDPGVNIASIVS